jgi:predicted N-acyltransferase
MNLYPPSNLFNQNFLNLFKKTECTGAHSGWDPIEFNNGDQTLFSFIKTHSYGEYIFDWQWASAYKQYQIPYYPKLTSMYPFTPATLPHTFNQLLSIDLFKKYSDFYLLNNFSSSHFLFTPKEENDFLSEQGYLSRHSFQYHFFNEGYENFDHFLNHLKTKKAKTIRNERSFKDLTIERMTGPSLKLEHAHEIFNFYLLTINEKQAIPYLKKKFFEELFLEFKNNVLYVRALKDDAPVAGALFYYDQFKLYGRYWGSKLYIPHLHFELCYYQGIEFCLEHKLLAFEAGAQGEHKIARGFTPVRILSSHHLKNPDFHLAISRFIEEEKKIVAKNIDDLSKLLPFK